MRVRVIKPFKAYWNYSVTEFGEGAELEGDQARHFTDNAPEGCIEVLETDPEPEQEQQEPEGEQGDGGGQEPDGEPPVDGTIDVLMAWVDGDPERAAAALAAEQAKEKPRSTVVKRLSAMADTGDGTGDTGDGTGGTGGSDTGDAGNSDDTGGSGSQE